MVSAGTVAGLRTVRVATVPYTRFLSSGDELPNAMLYDDEGAPVRLQAALAADRPTVVLLYSTTCGDCIAEADVWENLHLAFGSEFSFLGLAHGMDAAKVLEFTRVASISFPTMRVEEAFPRVIQAEGLPAAMIIEPLSRRVAFVAAGGEATDSLRRWLQDHHK